jgi:hypothetical protein
MENLAFPWSAKWKKAMDGFFHGKPVILGFSWRQPGITTLVRFR